MFLMFVVVTSLGPFNPFSPSYNPHRDGAESSPIALAVQSLFIILLTIATPKIVPGLRQSKIALIGFAGLFVLTGIAFAPMEIPFSFWILCVKLILCIVLILKLPTFLSQNPRLISYGMVFFLATSLTIAILFITGHLDSYTYWAGGRAVIFGENANSYSTRMACSAMFLLYLIVENPLRWGHYRFLFLGLEFPLIYAILASGSRGSFIMLFVCIILYTSYIPIKLKPLKWAFSLLMVGMLVYTVVYVIENNHDFSIIERLNSTVETGDDAGRTELSHAALDIFQNNPICGVGAIEFQNLMRSEYALTHTVHNVYWYVLSTTGLIGAMLFCYFLGQIGVMVVKERKYRPFALTLFVAMLLIGSKTGGALTYIMMWFVYALSVSLIIQKHNR